VIAQLARLLQQQHPEIFIARLVGQLLQLDRRAESGWTATHDAHVDFIGFPLDGFRVEAVVDGGESSSWGGGEGSSLAGGDRCGSVAA